MAHLAFEFVIISIMIITATVKLLNLETHIFDDFYGKKQSDYLSLRL